MICPKYKAAIMADPNVIEIPKANSPMIQCDKSLCAWWDGTRKKCSINTDQSKPEEEA
jgi:hypothetical protein